MCFSPFAQGHGHGHDSAIYAAIGNALNNGRTLYTGIIDNKGPLLYFIDAIGLQINYNFGIFFIEFVFLIIGTIFAYKTTLLITKNNKWLSCLSVIFTMLMLVYTLDGGNYTEEYAILFTNIATYFVVKFIKNNYDLKWFELVIVGICYAATFLLRANLCAFFVAQILVILFSMIKDKKYKKLLRAMGYVFLGILLFVTPFLIYLIKTNSLNECLGFVYFGVVNSFEKVYLMERFNKVTGLIEISNNSNVFTIAFISFILFIATYKTEKNKKTILIMTFIGIIINLYANSLTGGPAWAYTHYFISFVPILMITSAWFFNYVYSSIEKTKISKEIRVLIYVLLTLTLITTPAKELLKTSVTRANFKSPESNLMEKYIIDNTTEKDTIQIIGVNDTIYYPTNRISTSKHLYFVAGFSEDRRRNDANELATDLYNAEKKSKIIMLPSGNLEDLVFVNSLSDKNEFLRFIKKYYQFDELASAQLNCNVFQLK